MLQTLEADGTLLDHPWEQGDALFFLSHKYHCVSELTRGTRSVMVSELWQGTENDTPSRDEKERWVGHRLTGARCDAGGTPRSYGKADATSFCRTRPYIRVQP